ncbi:MAG: hypothetical protein ACI9YL_001835 [Luteibaculaceae bacterium]|jgi:hypothetical protein
MRDFFKLKIETQFVVFLATLLTSHLTFRFLGWDGQFAWVVLIPFLFSITNLFFFIVKGFRKSIWDWKYILIALLYFTLPLKITYLYYNILIPILLVAISVYILRVKDFKIQKLRHRLISLIGLNILIIATPDILVFKYIHCAENQVWGNRLEWVHFKGDEPINIGEKDAAEIVSDFYWKFNRVYNFPRFITLTVMEESGSWVRPKYNDYEGNLLKHEQLHFDITEWTRREFHDSLNNCRKVDKAIAIEIFKHYQNIESQRQTDYDSISKHGLDFNGQIKWSKKVKRKLN